MSVRVEGWRGVFYLLFLSQAKIRRWRKRSRWRKREREREREIIVLRRFDGARNLILKNAAVPVSSNNTSTCARLCRRRCRSSSPFVFFFRFPVDEHSSVPGSRVRGAKEKTPAKLAAIFANETFLSVSPRFSVLYSASSLCQTLASEHPARLFSR